MEKQQEIKEIFSELKGFCESKSDDALVKKYARFFKEGYDAYGVGEALMHTKRDEVLANHSNLGLEGFFDLSDMLFATGKYELGSFAIMFIDKHKRQYEKGAFKRVKKWFDEGITNWAHSDCVCGTQLRDMIQNGIVTADDFGGWRTSKSRWTRRAVPVALLGFLKKGEPVPALLAIIEPMMMDKERVVHQGLGWFLRDSWKKEPVPVEALLLRHKDESPRLIYQYATEKMDKAGKERFRAAKGK